MTPLKCLFFHRCGHNRGIPKIHPSPKQTNKKENMLFQTPNAGGIRHRQTGRSDYFYYNTAIWLVFFLLFANLYRACAFGA